MFDVIASTSSPLILSLSKNLNLKRVILSLSKNLNPKRVILSLAKNLNPKRVILSLAKNLNPSFDLSKPDPSVALPIREGLRMT